MSTDGGADLPADRPVTTVDGGPDRPDASAPDVPAADASDTRVTTLDAQVDLPPPLLANGTACHLGTECQFGNCVDGFCCESACTGQCQSCGEATMLGKCVTIKDAVRGIVRAPCPGSGTCASLCNGSDALACHYPANEKQCAPANCAAGVAKAASTCNGSGACTSVTGVSCASNLCADNTQCSGGCSAAQPCAATQYCEPTSKVCLPLKTNGVACVQGFECTSLACVDGVCCESACSGQCEACAEAVKGKCVAIAGAPRGNVRLACMGTRDACRGMCDGTTRTQCAYPGASVQCVPASCSSGTLTTASVCNSLGDCTLQMSSACHSTQCSVTPGQCLTCTAGANCAGGLVCDSNNGVCVAPASLAIAPSGPTTFPSTTVGQTSPTQTFVVTNNGAVPAGTTTGLLASLVGGDASQFTIVAGSTTCTGTVAPGGHCNVVVQFKPTSALGKTTTLSVSATPGLTVSVTLSGCAALPPAQACATGQNCGTASDGCGNTVSCGTCVAPQMCTGTPSHCATAAALSLSPTTGDFGNVILGTPKDTVFTLHNGGTLDASGIVVSVTGTGFSRTAAAGDCGSTLVGGGNCSITVRFTAPGLTAAQTGSLNVSATGGAMTQIAFRGNPIGILAVPLPPGATAAGFGGMSSDGTVLAGDLVMGTAPHTGFYWTVGGSAATVIPSVVPGEGIQIGAVSGDGRVVAGCEGNRVLRWSPGQGTPTLLTPPVAGGDGCATAMDSTGAIMVGDGNDIEGDGSTFGFIWRATTGVFQFASSLGQGNAEIFGLSNTGIAVGRAFGLADLGIWWAVQGTTTAAGVPLPTLPNFTSFARGVSANGAVIVGEADATASVLAVRWDTPFTSQPTQLPNLPGVAGAWAWAANQDGTVIVGTSDRAVAWTPGVQAIDGSLALAGVNLAGFALTSAFAVSSDGKIISGRGTINGVSGVWIARIP